jgi:hypothetical protein
MSDNLRAEDRAVKGTQAFLRCTSAPAGVAINVNLLDMPQLTVQGTYEFEIELSGLKELEVFLMPSQFAGTNFAPSLIIYYANRRKPKTTVAGVNFVAAASQTLSASSFKGEKLARVVFSLPAATTITFNPAAGAANPNGATPAAQAEYNGD